MSHYRSRSELFNYLQEYAATRSPEIRQHKTVRPLVKSYLIETYRKPVDDNTDNLKPFSEVSESLKLTKIDDTLFEAETPDDCQVFLEQLNDRYWVLFSTQPGEKMDQYVRQIVFSSTLLDHLWISGILFNVFWRELLAVHDPHRFVRMAFEYEDFFGSPDPKAIRESANKCIDEVDYEFEDKRVSRTEFTEKKQTMDRVLDELRSLLPSFHSISLMRFPSSTGPGGYDVYYTGKVTNRSASFLDHRSQIISLCSIYERATESIEDEVWLSVEQEPECSCDGQYKVKGAPVTMIFSEPLSEKTFENFIRVTFDKGTGPFRLWGNPIRVSPQDVHIYGIDMHLWQQIFLELTPKQFTVLLPAGTCGNTVHRLVTNVQRYLDPRVQVFVGDKSYEKMLEAAVKEA